MEFGEGPYSYQQSVCAIVGVQSKFVVCVSNNVRSRLTVTEHVAKVIPYGHVTLAPIPTTSHTRTLAGIFGTRKIMGQDEWYRNTTWDKETSELFESKLKRSRGAYHKAQYLRVQASYLLDSTNFQDVGVRLMERLIQDFPTEDFSATFGKEQLGDFYFKKGDFERAKAYYQEVTNQYKVKNRSGTSGVADIKLVDTILKLSEKEKFEEAYNLLTVDFEKTGGSLTLNDDRFFYARVFAELCDKLGKRDEAKQYAVKALEISKIVEPQFARHKTVGLVRTDKETLDRLTKIVDR